MATTRVQVTGRFRNDDGNETTATWIAVAGSSITPNIGTSDYTFRLRLNIRQTGTTSATHTQYLYVARNGGSYAQASATGSGGIQVALSGNVADADATTQQISAGTFVAGAIDELTGQCAATGTMAQNRDTEHEYVLKIVNAQVNNGDYFEFKAYQTTSPINTYTFVPKITVTKNIPPAVTLNAPADTLIYQTNTPLLNFTGTDADADAVEYKVGIGQADLFYSAYTNGSSSAFSFPSEADLQPAAKFTCGAWIKNTYRVADYGGIFQSYRQGYGLRLAQYASWIYTYITANGPSVGVISDHRVDDNKWHWIVMVYDQVDSRIYVDGVLDCTPGAYTSNATYNATSYIRIGCGNETGTNNQFYNSNIKDVFLINGTAWSATDVANKMYASLVGETGLKGYWRFQNGKTDSSGQGHTLTDIGTPTYSTNFYENLREIMAESVTPDPGFSTGHPYTSGVAKEYAINQFDNFNDNTFDAGLWTRTNSTQIVETNSQLEMTSLLAGNYVSLDSVINVNLTGKSISIQIVDVGNQSLTSWETFPLNLIKDGSNVLTYRIIGNNIQAYKNVAGVSAQVGGNLAYVSTTHRYFRIREAAGTCYWDWSTDGITWTNQTSVANPFAITSLQIEVSVGTWQAEASTTTMKVDNIFYGVDLVDGTTYYWHVAAKDPSGTNVYGEWSSTRSFTKGALYIPRQGFINMNNPGIA